MSRKLRENWQIPGWVPENLVFRGTRIIAHALRRTSHAKETSVPKLEQGLTGLVIGDRNPSLYTSAFPQTPALGHCHCIAHGLAKSIACRAGWEQDFGQRRFPRGLKFYETLEADPGS
jgi:hypothetical protein